MQHNQHINPNPTINHAGFDNHTYQYDGKAVEDKPIIHDLNHPAGYIQEIQRLLNSADERIARNGAELARLKAILIQQ